MFAAIAERRGIIQVHAFPEHAGQLDSAASRWPQITWLIDHMMYPQPEWAAENWAPYEPVLALAAHPNVGIKISDVHNRSQQEFPHADMLPVVRRAVEAFGADRILWGTGYPGCHRVKYGWPTLAEELRIVEEAFDFLSPEERSGMLGENAARIWGLK